MTVTRTHHQVRVVVQSGVMGKSCWSIRVAQMDCIEYTMGFKSSEVESYNITSYVMLSESYF